MIADPNQHVAVLCAARRSVYHGLANVEVYDTARDARTFSGGMPVIAHPPCRGWSRNLARQAKPEPGEMELGIWCAEQVRLCGGVLEQPAFSRLWNAADLPLPGSPPMGDLWAIEVWQSWWGYPIRKRTWLCLSGVDQRDVCVPLVLRESRGDGLRFELMSHHQRSATTVAFAEWLVDLARRSRIKSPTQADAGVTK